MSPEAQRIAIAEVCGFVEFFPTGDERPIGKRPRPSDGELSLYPVPDYLGDLNEVHDLELVLPPGAQQVYAANLIDICDRALHTTDRKATPFIIFTATAAQRAEAFLRTLGKWKDA